MGDPTLSANLEVVFRHLASPIVKKVVPLLGCENAVTKVRRMLLRIQAVLRDAEERHVKDEAVRNWLCDLKGVVCDADDVFDELTTRVLQLRLEFAVCTSASVPGDLLSSDFSARISGIGEKLDEIARESVGLGLNEVVGVNRVPVVKERRRSGDHRGDLVVDEEESCVLGRNLDTENVIKMLLGNDDNDDSIRNDLNVISIVGMGGIGKTTLARKVFNDVRIERHFRMRIWVSVLEGFDSKMLIKAIIESATGDRYLLLGLEAMQRNLRAIVGGKRFLLVLDNIHDDNCNDWKIVEMPLMSGAIGSKVLVTTSSSTATKLINSSSLYQMKGLSSEDCWSLFSLHAFGDMTTDPDPDLALIGKEIVNRCRGLPLVVKALGSLMHTRKDEYEWRHILKNQIWNIPVKNKVYFPALWLSYLHLPMHLKQCFMYCSMLPKDAKFGKDHLIRLWMAQGFIFPNENETMEDLGREYFEDLLWRSFFQYSHFDFEDDESKYVMHEAIHEFAHFISSNEYFQVQYAGSCGFSKNARHLSFNSSGIEKLSLESFSESQGLRTLSVAGECKLHEWKVPSSLFFRLNCLRVLDLNTTSLQALPDSVGNLIHLRYLGLVGTRIEELPESVCGLYNLQILNLSDCFALKELPKGIKNLTNLRHLNLQLRQCKVSGLSSFPSGFGQLTCLQTLSIFVVGHNDDCKIDELKHITNLRGKLCISKLDNVVQEDEARDADMKNKEYIHKLELQWNLGSKVEGGIQEKVLENLKPHINLKELTIRGFGGVTLPSWIGDPEFFNLVTINLTDCPECNIPSFGQLPSLKHFSMEKMGVKNIQHDCSSGGKVISFPSLETLRFDNLLQLEEWSGVGEGDMPLLQEFVIVGCSKLRIFPRTLGTLRKLEMWNCFCLTSLPRVPSLNSLVMRCPTSSLLRSLHELKSLLHLEIKNCPELTSLPTYLRNLSSLEVLIIHDCKQLNMLLEGLKDLTSLEYLEISGCPQLQSLPGELPKSLQSLSITACPSLAQWCQSTGVEKWRLMSLNFSTCIDGQKNVNH